MQLERRAHVTRGRCLSRDANFERLRRFSRARRSRLRAELPWDTVYPMPEKPLAVRFTEEQVARFDRIAEKLSALAAGTRVTRSDAIRAAAERGAALLEAELRLTKPKRPKK
jgi:hypothetical protein